MTGYGKATATFGTKKISIEVKSLNSKALDLSTRIAPIYREKEMEVRRKVAQAIVRGKVDVTITVEHDAAAEAHTVNAMMIAHYHRELLAAARATAIAEPQDWWPLLVRMPDVLTKSDSDELTDEEWTVVAAAVDEALEQLVAFRRQEGEALQRMFEAKISNIADLLASIEPYEQERVEKIRRRIVDGLKTIPEVDYDKNRLEQELIYYIEKLDISEEKQRLGNHLAYFRQTMGEPAGQGKKLGFITQEMGREINTTGSKSNNAEMQNIVVRMKDELEQIKEQVLNVL